MKPIYQTILHPPNGNCLQAAIASIFELQLDDLPNFTEYEDCWTALDNFLREHDLYAIRVVIDDDRFVPRGYHLINGKSPRGNYDHVLVAKDGKPVHDPNKNGGCTLSSMDEWVLFVRTFNKLAG